jgi:hypothetical protein
MSRFIGLILFIPTSVLDRADRRAARPSPVEAPLEVAFGIFLLLISLRFLISLIG